MEREGPDGVHEWMVILEYESTGKIRLSWLNGLVGPFFKFESIWILTHENIEVWKTFYTVRLVIHSSFLSYFLLIFLKISKIQNFKNKKSPTSKIGSNRIRRLPPIFPIFPMNFETMLVPRLSCSLSCSSPPAFPSSPSLFEVSLSGESTHGATTRHRSMYINFTMIFPNNVEQSNLRKYSAKKIMCTHDSYM